MEVIASHEQIRRELLVCLTTSDEHMMDYDSKAFIECDFILIALYR